MKSKNVTSLVASYISKSQEASIPKEVIEKAKHHILDTFAAILSGSLLEAGRLALRAARVRMFAGIVTLLRDSRRGRPRS